MRIKAKYKGKPRRHYKTDHAYFLDFNTVSIARRAQFVERIQVEKFRDWDRVSTVHYTSLKRFTENWEVL